MQNNKVSGLFISIAGTHTSDPLVNTKRSASITDVNVNCKAGDYIDASFEPASALKKKQCLSLPTFACLPPVTTGEDLSSLGPHETLLSTQLSSELTGRISQVDSIKDKQDTEKIQILNHRQPLY